MKVVTGYKGFIGSKLMTRLEARGEEVIGIEQDYWDSPFKDLTDLIRECNGVYHVGANSSTTYTDPDIFRTNFLQSIQLLNVCKQYDIRMVFASSASIYGDDGVPKNLYAWTKLCTELVGDSYSPAIYEGGFVALRYFNVYGPGEEHKGKLASIAHQAHLHYKLKGTPFKLCAGTPKRDFIYIDDVVEANIYAMECENLLRTSYDVGTGYARPFSDLLRGMSIPYEYYTDEESEQLKPFGYQNHTKAAAKSFLPGWAPKYNMELATQLYREYLNE